MGSIKHKTPIPQTAQTPNCGHKKKEFLSIFGRGAPKKNKIESEVPKAKSAKRVKQISKGGNGRKKIPPPQLFGKKFLSCAFSKTVFCGLWCF
jgi:hypothetical protein